MFVRAFLLFCSAFAFITSVFAQKPIEMADVHRWRKIEQQQVSANGQWVSYTLAPQTEGDNVLCLWNTQTGTTTRFERSSDAKFSDDNQWLVFKTKPALDSLKAMRRKKVKEDDLPKDTLVIFTLASGATEKIARVKTFTMPEKWSGWLAIHLEAAAKPKDTEAKKDTSKTEKPPKKVEEPAAVKLKENEVPKDTAKISKAPKPKTTPKKEGKETGTMLLVRNLMAGKTDTFPFVQRYVLAEKNPALLFVTTGNTDTLPKRRPVAQNGVYHLDLEQNTLKSLWRGKGKYQDIALAPNGKRAAFLADTDTSKAVIRPWQLCAWEAGTDSARTVSLRTIRAVDGVTSTNPADKNQPLPAQGGIGFSDDGDQLYFGIAPRPILPDTTLLPEEIVQVEVWAGSAPHLYTELENSLEAEKKRSFQAVYRWKQQEAVLLGDITMPELRFQMQPLLRNAEWALAFNEEPYAHELQWDGTAHKDLYAISLNKGVKTLIAKNIRAKTRISPDTKYALWWQDADSCWVAWNAVTGKTVRLADNRNGRWADERNDLPDYPDEYGSTGWLQNDEAVLIYDRYDLWQFDPTGQKTPQRLTHGREGKVVYRYIRLDPEERSIRPGSRILLHQFNETTKAEGYAWLDLKSGKLSAWFGGDFAYTRTPIKAKRANTFVFTQQSCALFPDLNAIQIPDNEHIASSAQRVSTANPQQSEYRWPTVEMVQWRSLQGQTLSGLLYKPADFDPKRSYPMIVNFYERLSDGLHNHIVPHFGRSQINYTQYVSRGYVVFLPDIEYRVGYPGESAYDAIVSGVNAIVARGGIDPNRIGLQGHSWGGYQAAYLVTRTDMFKCAEAGAPVSNMTSAYGGIRWESGMNRQFQYEHQQSRIGGSLWEKPKQFIENSPLFALDKVHTPLLILHNDADGAVPWQQGIELFTGLRRLEQPVWMLNYNDEPHWPVKLQNRIDFQMRMQQFFDYYLLGKPEPKWMLRGVPPIEKGGRGVIKEE